MAEPLNATILREFLQRYTPAQVAAYIGQVAILSKEGDSPQKQTTLKAIEQAARTAGVALPDAMREEVGMLGVERYPSVLIFKHKATLFSVHSRDVLAQAIMEANNPALANQAAELASRHNEAGFIQALAAKGYRPDKMTLEQMQANAKARPSDTALPAAIAGLSVAEPAANVVSEPVVASPPMPPERPATLTPKPAIAPAVPQVSAPATAPASPRATITPGEMPVKNVPAFAFPPSAPLPWQRAGTLSQHEQRMLQTVAGWEGGFTDKNFDGNVTLYGLIAGTLVGPNAENARKYLGRTVSTAEAENYLRYLSLGLNAQGAKPAGEQQARRGTNFTNESTQLQCKQLEFARDHLVPSLLLNEFMGKYNFHAIENRDVQQQVFHLSMNAGAPRALYALDQARYTLEGKLFYQTNPADDKNSIYSPEGGKTQRPEALKNYQTFAADVVTRFNAAAKGKDPEFVQQQVYNSARLFYTELTQVGARNTKYIRGWLNRADDVYNKPIDAVTITPRQTPNCERPLERVEQRAEHSVANTKESPAAGMCAFAPTVRDSIKGNVIQRESIAAQSLPYNNAQQCQALGGQFKPAATPAASSAAPKPAATPARN